MGYFLEIGFDAQFCGQIEKIVFVRDLKNDTIEKVFVEHIGILPDKNCYIDILGNAENPVMLYEEDSIYGDLRACCPECKKPFYTPLGWRGNSYPCTDCGKLLKSHTSNF